MATQVRIPCDNSVTSLLRNFDDPCDSSTFIITSLLLPIPTISLISPARFIHFFSSPSQPSIDTSSFASFQISTPHHPVAAITVFFLLVVAFYAFFAPFLGGRIWESVRMGIYSPLAIMVFIFYVRSTAINSADPGIMYKFDLVLMNEVREKRESTAHDLGRKYDEGSNGTHSCPSSPSRSSFAGANSSKKGSVESVK
ncbi:hypothetical protein OROHE_000206 [Orobanche hederae]